MKEELEELFSKEEIVHIDRMKISFKNTIIYFDNVKFSRGHILSYEKAYPYYEAINTESK